MHLRYLSLALPAALAACSSTYHPEYHPVTQLSQQVTYPVIVGPDSPRTVVIQPPPPAAAPTVPPPPPGFFAPE